MEILPIAHNARLAAIRAAYGDDNRRPLPDDETRIAIAYDRDNREIGRFCVRAADCLAPDTITWRGYYWSNALLAEACESVYPGWQSAGWDPDDPRPISGIRPSAAT